MIDSSDRTHASPSADGPAARIRSLAVLVLLAVGLAGAGAGLLGLDFPRALPFEPIGAINLGLALTCLGLVVLTLLRRGWAPQRTAMAATAVVALGSGDPWALVAALACFAAWAVLGRMLVERLSPAASGTGWLVCMLLGAGTTGTIVGLAAHLPINRPGVHGLAIASILWLGRRQLPEIGSRIAGQWRAATGPVSQAAGAMVSSVLAILYVVVAFMPELMHDALALHLFVPVQVASRHAWGFDVSTYVWAVMPMLGDWLFTLPYMLAGESAARLVNVGFILALGWQVRALVLALGGNPRSADLALALFLSTPLTFLVGSSLYIESIWTSFLLGGSLLVLSAACGRRVRGELWIAGALLGFAFAAKIGSLPALLVLLAVAAIGAERGSWKGRGREGATALAAMLVLGAVPYATAWVLTGNPVFPFMNEVFESPFYPAENFDNPTYHSGLAWDLPYRIVFEASNYLEASTGAGGFQWLLLLAASLVLGIRRGSRQLWLLIAFGMGTLVLVFQAQSYLRYIFVSYVVLSAALGYAAHRASGHGRLVQRSFVSVAWLALALNLAFFTSGTWAYRDMPLRTLAGESERVRYLRERLPIRHAMTVVNGLNAHRTPVAVLGHPLTAGLESDALYMNWYNTAFLEAMYGAEEPEDVAAVLRARNVTFVVIDESWSPLLDGGDFWKRGEIAQRVREVTLELARFGSVSVRKRDDGSR